MSDQLNAPEEPATGIEGVTPIMRLRDARWLLTACCCLMLAACWIYQIPFMFGVSAMALLVLVAILPRRSRSMKLQVSKRRELRRMWPGTGMKMTVDAMPVPCFVADSTGITRYINKAALDTYGSASPGEPLSFSLRAPSLLEAFDRVAKSGKTERIHWQEKVPTEAFFEAQLAPIYMPGSATGGHVRNQPDFILVIIVDQTEQKRLERMRTDFVANASHELRTPLASLTGFIETLLGPAKNDPEARDRFLQIMLEQSSRMGRLIDDILSLSRIELKVHVRPTTPVDVAEIVRHTTDALGPLAADMDMQIRVNVEDGPTVVKGERDELIQVTENLVENALKYGNTGKFVDITLFRKAEPDGKEHLCLSVRDYGEGIPAEHLPRLTERFYRVDVASSRAMKGTGLGLAIVKHILARHRARLDIKSKPGDGATFTVIFAAGE